MSDERMIRIEDKIDKMSDNISGIKVTMVEQHVSLKEHMRRTEILETAIVPIIKRYDAETAIRRLAGKLAAALLAGAALVEIISYIKHL